MTRVGSLRGVLLSGFLYTLLAVAVADGAPVLRGGIDAAVAATATAAAAAAADNDTDEIPRELFGVCAACIKERAKKRVCYYNQCQNAKSRYACISTECKNEYQKLKSCRIQKCQNGNKPNIIQ